MSYPIHLRAICGWRCAAWWLALCVAVFACAQAARAQNEPATVPAQSEPASVPAPTDAAATPVGTAVVAVGAQAIQPTAGKRQLREAEDAYLSGAKKLEHDDLSAAETEFQRALKLDPGNRNYAVAISVTREHRLAELMQQATKARQTGDPAKAETLIAEARAIDPENPLVAEHSGPFLAGNLSRPPGRAASDPGAAATLADRARMIAGSADDEAVRIEGPVLAGEIRLVPADMTKSFHQHGQSSDVLRNVASGYGITAVVDDSVQERNVRFDLEDVTYQQAMNLLETMTHTFAVPLDKTSILVANDDATNRDRLQRQLEETINLPGYTPEQLNDVSTLLKTVFGVNAKQLNVQPSTENIVVRAPEDILDPMNRTLRTLADAAGEVVIEVKLYEVDATRTTSAGGTIPNGFGVYNVEAAATSLVSQNETLVQQAIAQGLISSTASNLEIAAALIGSGLVKSSLLSSTIGIFGNGLTQTGITESGSVGFNLGLNTSDTRALDDVQLRVGDRESATFREGTRYPIVTSTYTTGLSAASSSLPNATINGVSVASLLSQYAGGTSATIPQVSYEDLGVTLEATPVIQKSGRIDMKLNLKIEALSGSTSDGNPVLESRQFKSDMTVADGESAMMVSNVSRTENAAMTGVPGLSELPGFQMPLNDNLEKDTSQLVVLVTPHIVRRNPNLFAGPRIPVKPLPLN
jgi:type II secretory pathway component GspD/PulD (secretin)